MVKTSVKIYFAVSLIFFIALAGYIWYSIDGFKKNGDTSAAEIINVLQKDAEVSYSLSKGFSGSGFSQRVREIMSSYSELSGLIIYSKLEGPVYFNIYDKKILNSDPSDISGWNGQPDFNLYNPFFTQRSVKLSVPSSDLFLTIVVNTFTRSSILPVLRNSLVLAVLFLLVTGIFLSINGSRNAAVTTNDKPYNEDSSPDNNEDPADERVDPQAAAVSDSRPKEDTGSLFSPKSGLVWEHLLPERLSAELKRAASFDQDACLTFISIKSPSGFIPYRNISELIIEHFNYKDLAFEYGSSDFCIIIPDKDIDEGHTDVERFKKSIQNRFPKSAFKIFAGLTSRNGRLLNEERMIHEAKVALSKAEKETGSSTIAFRTDLKKYRQFIATKV